MAISKAKQLEQLEQECRERGIRLIYDDLRSEGGLCRLRGSFFLILNRRLAVETRVRAITDALARDMTASGFRESGLGADFGIRTPDPSPQPLASLSEDLVPGTVPEVLTETAAAPEPVAAPPPPATPRPEPEYEEPEVGVPLAAGVPDSHS